MTPVQVWVPAGTLTTAAAVRDTSRSASTAEVMSPSAATALPVARTGEIVPATTAVAVRRCRVRFMEGASWV
jgi:hypothetical protein